MKNKFFQELLPDFESVLTNSPLYHGLEQFYFRDYHEDLIENKRTGLEREQQVKEELEEKYPLEKGYTILSEIYLRDENGKSVADPVTGERRRVDFAVIRNNQVIEMIEVTSLTADKQLQIAKENRIREAGGNYIRNQNGELCKIPDSMHTKIERRT